MKWVVGNCLTNPYQSFGVDVGLLTGYKAAHWLRNVPLTSYLSSYSAKPLPPTFIIMPAQRNAYHSITSSGSFVMRASLHQQNDRASVRLWTAVATDRHSYIPVELRSATALQKLG